MLVRDKLEFLVDSKLGGTGQKKLNFKEPEYGIRMPSGYHMPQLCGGLLGASVVAAISHMDKLVSRSIALSAPQVLRHYYCN